MCQFLLQHVKEEFNGTVARSVRGPLRVRVAGGMNGIDNTIVEMGF